MTAKRSKIVAIRLQGQTDSAYPLGDPTGMWYGDMWLVPAAPDPLLDEIQRLLWQTRRLRDVVGFPDGPALFTDSLGFIAKHGTPPERAQARILRARLRRRDRADRARQP